jgi:phage baseplate assembly protein W
MTGSPGFNLPFNFPLGGPGQDRTASPKKPFYGKDLLFIYSSLQVTPKGDYATVEEEENLRRAIWRRLITAPGEYRLRPNYGAGVEDFVRKPMTQANLSQLEIRIREQLLQDRRVESVPTITLTPTVFTTSSGGQQPGLVVEIQVQALGRTMRTMRYDFSREA